MITPQEVRYIAGNNLWRSIGKNKKKDSKGKILEFVKGTWKIVVNCEKSTVETTMNHHRYGLTTLIRKDIDFSLLTHVFHNPRVHTDKGRYKRKLNTTHSA